MNLKLTWLDFTVMAVIFLAVGIALSYAIKQRVMKKLDDGTTMNIGDLEPHLFTPKKETVKTVLTNK